MSNNDEVKNLFNYFLKKFKKGHIPQDGILYGGIMNLLQLPEEDRNVALSFLNTISSEQERNLKVYNAIFTGEDRMSSPQKFLENIDSPKYVFINSLYKRLISTPDLEFTTNSGIKLVIQMSKTELKRYFLHFYVRMSGSKYPFLRIRSRPLNNIFNNKTKDQIFSEEDVKELEKELLYRVISRCNAKSTISNSAYIVEKNRLYNLRVAMDSQKFYFDTESDPNTSIEEYNKIERDHYYVALRNLLNRYEIGNTINTEVLEFIMTMPSTYVMKTKKYVFITRQNEKDIAIDINTRMRLSLDKKTEQYKELSLIKSLMV